MARRAVTGFSSATGAEGALRTWSGVREDKRKPADPVDDVKNGAQGGGNKGSTEKGFRPVDLVGKGDEVATLVDSSLIGKSLEQLPLLRGNTESSFNRDLGVSMLAFPHLKPTVTAWPGGGGGGHPR